jgi:hypothetical protein
MVDAWPVICARKFHSNGSKIVLYRDTDFDIYAASMSRCTPVIPVEWVELNKALSELELFISF